MGPSAAFFFARRVSFFSRRRRVFPTMLPTGTRTVKDDVVEENTRDISVMPAAGVRRISEYASSLFQHAIVPPRHDNPRPKTRRLDGKTVMDDSFEGSTPIPFAQTHR